MTQKDYLREYFKKNVGKWIPIWEFVKMGVYRYGDVMYRLKKEGMRFEKKEKVVKHRKFTKQRQVAYRYITEEFLNANQKNEKE